MKCVVIITILSAISLSTAVDDPTIVTLPDGQIRGRELLTSNDKTFYAFQEIPYAEPPVGDLRFQAPIAPTPWEGILNTTKNTKMCFQTGDSLLSANLTKSEDCLFLNVYTPLKPGDSSETPLPVLVWIHGGSFRHGVGAFQIFNPGYLIEKDIVVVTINYRLGPLGFLTTEDGVIPGNNGLKDQHLALQWVKKNINLFGGDPDKITLTGQSAGATSVGWHLDSPRNKGLFRAAILQSCTAITYRAHQNYARFYAFELGKYLDPNFTSDDSKELLALLRNVSVVDINNNKVRSTVGKESDIVEGKGQIWTPVIEDASLEGAFVTDLPYEDFTNGNIIQVPILIGFNSEEELLFLLNNDPLDPKSLAKYFDSDLSNLIRNKFNMTTANKLTAGEKIREIYTSGTFEDDVGAVVKFRTDESFTTPIIRHAKLQSNYTDVFLYQFSYKGKMGGLEGAEIGGVQGVGHAEDVRYLWGAPNSNSPSGDPNDLITRNRLVTMWSNFLKHLNPTPESDKLLDNVIWEKVTPNNLVYLNINNTLEMQKNPKEYLNWERIIDLYAIPPLKNY